MRPIDAESLTTNIAQIAKNCARSDAQKALISRILFMIDNMPTIEAQPVKYGRWIIDYAEGRKIYHAHCSECGKEPTRNIGGDYYIDKLSDYCPNCGSKNKMDGDTDDKP